MKSRDEILISMLRRNLSKVKTADDIKNLLNDFFEVAEDFEETIESQWTIVGYVFDLYRKDVLK